MTADKYCSQASQLRVLLRSARSAELKLRAELRQLQRSATAQEAEAAEIRTEHIRFFSALREALHNVNVDDDFGELLEGILLAGGEAALWCSNCGSRCAAGVWFDGDFGLEGRGGYCSACAGPFGEVEGVDSD